MKVEIKDYDDNVIQTFEGSAEEASRGFVDYIRDRKFKPGEIFPWFTEGTSISDAEAFFDKTTYSVVKEDLLPYIEYGYFQGLSIEGDFSGLNGNSEVKHISMKLEKTETGEYEVYKPFVSVNVIDINQIEEENKRKTEEEQIKFIPDNRTTVYQPDTINFDKNGKLIGGRPKLMSIHDIKVAVGFCEFLKNPEY